MSDKVSSAVSIPWDDDVRVDSVDGDMSDCCGRSVAGVVASSRAGVDADAAGLFGFTMRKLPNADMIDGI